MAPAITIRVRIILSNQCTSLDEMGKGGKASKHYIIVKSADQENFI
jgi:hypothetical protein